MMSFLRTWLALARPATLPTIWSNCLAGWWLGGAGNEENLPFLFIGATTLYLGGVFLNDAFDAKFDKKHRRYRPIPSGAVSLQAVWNWGFAFLAVGMVSLFWVGRTAGSLGVIMIICIVIYNAVHRALPFSTTLLGLCRLLLYLIAASAALFGVTGWAIWCGIAAGIYGMASHRITRPKILAGPGRDWTLIPLCVPIALALLLNDGTYRQAGLLLSAVFALWTARSLRPALWSEEKDTKRTASGLLAGFVFVDLLAVASAPREITFIFLPLFGLALVFQRPIGQKAPG